MLTLGYEQQRFMADQERDLTIIKITITKNESARANFISN